MNSKTLMIFSLIGFVITGLIRVLYRIYKNIQDYNFVVEYSLKLGELLNGKISNNDYGYIFKNATKLSETMGSFGIIDYKPPFANYYYKNYNIINTILNYQDSIMDDEIKLALKQMYIYLGACDSSIEKLKKHLKNPLILFAEGFRFIFNIPLFAAYSLGIFSGKMYYKIKGNGIYYFFQNVVGLIGFISSLIGIIQGKEFLFMSYSKILQIISSIFS
jgi:hypothetical protein